MVEAIVDIKRFKLDEVSLCHKFSVFYFIMELYEAAPNELEDQMNGLPDFNLGDPYAYERVMPSRQNQSRQTVNQGIAASMMRSAFPAFWTNPEGKVPASASRNREVRQGPTNTKGEEISAKDFLGQINDCNKNCGPEESAIEPIMKFQLEGGDWENPSDKTPPEHCKDCCEQVEKTWNKGCSALHKAIEKKLKKVGCPANVSASKSSSSTSRSRRFGSRRSKRRSTVRRSTRRRRR